MKSRHSSMVLLIGGVLAFLPVLAVDYLLDRYVRARETSRIQTAIDGITTELQQSVYDGLKAIREVLDESPSLCTPTFLANVRTQLRMRITLRQMLVENADGVQYCDGFADDVVFRPVSASLSLPGRSETITIVNLEYSELPALKVTRAVGSKYLSAFMSLGADIKRGLPAGMGPDSSFTVSLTNGDPVVSFGDESAFRNRSSNDAFIVVNSFAGEIPLRSEASLPFADVRADYADLDVGLTIFACVLSCALLLAALNFSRRSRLPSVDLENAIASGELKPYYQPVIDLTTGRVLGCEVLVRWEKRSGEVVAPGAFIDYAEVSGLAIPMTVHLMQRVKLDLSEICRDYPKLKISINLFEGHFRDNSIVEDVQAIFGGSSIKFRQLVFEITERRPFSNNVQANSVIAGLHSLGARLALDDVGTGHSNLAYLQTLGVDVIKIDRVFVDMIKDDTKSVPVLDGLISMAKQMEAEVVAEGVETEAQAIYLREHGIIQAQGFLFAPALKPDSFIALTKALNADEQGVDVTGLDGSEAVRPQSTAA